MKTTFSLSHFLVVLVLFAAILPGHKLATKIKTQCTFTEVSLSDVENDNFLDSHDEASASVFLIVANFFVSELIIHSSIKEPVVNLEKNSSLGFLYLAHSPPRLS